MRENWDSGNLEQYTLEKKNFEKRNYVDNFFLTAIAHHMRFK